MLRRFRKGTILVNKKEVCKYRYGVITEVYNEVNSEFPYEIKFVKIELNDESIETILHMISNGADILVSDYECMSKLVWI